MHFCILIDFFRLKNLYLSEHSVMRRYPNTGWRFLIGPVIQSIKNKSARYKTGESFTFSRVILAFILNILVKTKEGSL